MLHDKATKFDTDMEQNHVDVNGMIGNGGGAPGSINVSGDGALHTGCWVASQVYRFQATGDAQALANVEKGVNALCLLVEICPNKNEFARAVWPTATAPSNWIAGTGAFAGISWLQGGNNDMLHGIDYGLLAAEQVLPAGHALRARMAAATKSLLDNVSIAQSGTHQVFLASVSAKCSNDPAEIARYKTALQGNTKDRIWTQLGGGLIMEQGIADWSGHHLGACAFCAERILGGANPDPDEQGWKNVGASGAKAAYVAMWTAREGMVDAIAAAVGAQGAGDQTKDVLAEIPCPKPLGDAKFEPACTDFWSVSPYPSDPWKFDWMTNLGRVQALYGLQLFYRGADENYWARGPLETDSNVGPNQQTSQDYLHAYWLGRVAGYITPND
jgi:hypothetical protein